MTELIKRGVTSVQAGESPEVVARVFGISRMTIYNWLALYRRGGWHALDAKKRGGRPPKEEVNMMRRLPAVRRGPFLLESNLSRLVDEAFSDFHRIGFDISPSFGRTDVYEQEQALMFETELPGVKKDEIAIKVEDDQLVISGEVKRNEQIDRENYFRVGRRYGRFQRCFPLPADLIQTDDIKAKFEDGILTITAPMKESIKEKGKPIEIAVA